MQKAQPSPTASSLPPSPNRLQEQQQLLSFSLLQNAQSEYAEPNKLKQMEVRPGQVLLSSHCDVSVALQIHRELQLFGFGFFFFFETKTSERCSSLGLAVRKAQPTPSPPLQPTSGCPPCLQHCNSPSNCKALSPVPHHTKPRGIHFSLLSQNGPISTLSSGCSEQLQRRAEALFSQRPAGLAECWHQTCSGSQAVLRRQILGRNSHSSHQAQMNSRTRRWVCLNRHHIS